MSFRVYHIAPIGTEGKFYPVRSPLHGLILIEAMADSDLLDDSITSNAFGLEVQGSDGEWEDWEDDQGRGINDQGVDVRSDSHSKLNFPKWKLLAEEHLESGE